MDAIWFAPEITGFDDPENPTIMDKIVEALGAEVVDWSYKVNCCGGGLSIVAPEVVKKLTGKIVMAASEVGADAIVTACGICQANLDMRQPKGSGIPSRADILFQRIVCAGIWKFKCEGMAGKTPGRSVRFAGKTEAAIG